MCLVFAHQFACKVFYSARRLQLQEVGNLMARPKFWKIVGVVVVLICVVVSLLAIYLSHEDEEQRISRGKFLDDLALYVYKICVM